MGIRRTAAIAALTVPLVGASGLWAGCTPLSGSTLEQLRKSTSTTTVAPTTTVPRSSSTVPTTVATTVAPATTTTVRPTTTTVAPTTTTAPGTTVAPTTTVAPRAAGFPGDVAPGTVRWGAAIGGNADPVARHESIAGGPMGLRRTYFRWDQRTTSMATTARTDLAAGRLPWVSVKTPGWDLMASGAVDADIDAMLRALDGAGGPVWLTVHHEPEGGGGSIDGGPDDVGGAPAWRAMQAKVRQRMTAVGTRNVAFAPILMSWTFDSRSGRNPADWWVSGVWDFAGIDHYQESEPATSVEERMWSATTAFYRSKGIKLAVGEWANRGTDAAAATEMSAFYDSALRSATNGGPQVIGLAYFDSGLNSPLGSYELLGAPLDRFRSLMRADTSLLAHETR